MTLTLEQLRTMELGQPVRLRLPEATSECVLVRADVFERLAQISDDDWDPKAMMAAFAKVAGADGWDDPAMDVYEEYRNQP